jgi:peptide/nickel transport system ATP-binding protein
MIALPLLDIRDLTVEFSTRRGIVRAVEHVDIAIAKGRPSASWANPAPESR